MAFLPGMQAISREYQDRDEQGENMTGVKTAMFRQAQGGKGGNECRVKIKLAAKPAVVDLPVPGKCDESCYKGNNADGRMKNTEPG